jgi:hypothetical protein
VNIYGVVRLISKLFKDFSPVSVFKPWVASFIYDKYLPNGGIVVDPCMGWGGRLLGCINRNIKYTGYDLNQLAVDAHVVLHRYVRVQLGECTFTQADSSSCDFADGDLLLTSPPYDDCERYYGIDSHKTTTKPIIDNILSKFKGIVALNVPLRQREMVAACGQLAGRVLLEELQMKTASFMGREKTYEPVLVFKARSSYCR